MNTQVTAPSTIVVGTIDLPTTTQRHCDGFKTKALSILIASDADYIAAADYANAMKAEWDAVEAERVKLKAPSLAAVTGIDNHYRQPLRTLAEGIADIKEKILAYDKLRREQAEAKRQQEERERKAREAEALRIEQEAANKRREEERLRQEAIDAETKRQQAKVDEAQAQARQQEELRKAAEAAALGDRVRADAAEAAAKKSEEEAAAARVTADEEREKAVVAKIAEMKAQREVQALRTEAATTREEPPPPAPATTLAKVGATRVTWKFRVIDAGKVERKWCGPDLDKIGEFVTRMKEHAAEHLGPGIEVYADETLNLRAKKGVISD